MPISRNLLESDQSFSARQAKSSDKELAIREAIQSAMQNNDADAELAAREQLEAFKYASQSVSDPRVETALQGATFGFGDEAAAAINTIPGYLSAKMEGSPASFGDIYSQNVAPIRESISAYREENPKSAFGFDLAGGLLTGGAAYKGLTKGVPALARLSTIPKLMGTGAAFGGASGFGRTDGGIGERLAGGGIGAGLGAGFGLGLGLLGTAANNYLVQPLMRAIKNPKDAAQQAVIGSLADDGLTPIMAQKELAKLGPQGTLADLGKNMNAVAGTVSRLSGEAGAKAEKVLQSRVEGGPQRLQSALRNILGNDKNAMTEFAAIDAARKTQASPLYQQAHKELIQLDDELLPLVQKAGSGIYAKALRIFNTDPDAPPIKWPSFKEIEQGKTVPLAVLDYMKRALSGAARSVGGNKELGGAQGKLAERLTEQLNKRSDAYNQGRQIYADQSRLLDAMKSGMNILKDSPDDIAVQLGKLNQSEQDVYRLGMIRAVENELKKVNIGSDASKKVIRTELLKDRLRAAMPDEDALNAFIRAAEKENIFATTRNEALRGSQTRARQIADAKFVTQQAQSVSQDVLDGNLGTAAKKIIGFVGKSKELGDEELARRVGDIIFAQGEDAMKLLVQAQKAATPGKISRVLSMVNKYAPVPDTKTIPPAIIGATANEAGIVPNYKSGQ